MGFENNSETRLTVKEDNGAFEISPLKSDNCDNNTSFSIDRFFNSILKNNTCDILLEIDKITVLELSYCNLTDLPMDCKSLNLKQLGLSHNKLKSVPSCLYSGLKFLESLDLSYNSIPNFTMEPECISFLKILKLNNNNLDNLPKWILMFKCTNLEELNYSYNDAKHYKYLKNSFNLNLFKLKKLELLNSCLRDNDSSFLKCFKTLEYIDLSNEEKQFTNILHDIDELFVNLKWTELKILKLNDLSISIFPEGICWIENLEELHLSENCLSWLPESIEFLVNLQVLNISNNSIISIPKSLTSLESLTTLKASHNCIEAIPDFTLMQKLRFLDFYDNFIEEININIQNIDNLDIEDNYFDTEKLENYSEYCEKRKKLREKYGEQNRYEGPKTREEFSDSSSDGIDEDLDWDAKEIILLSKDDVNDTENWDLPDTIRAENPEIDSIDNEWQGEENTSSVKQKLRKEKVYISDEDWMFVDYESS